MADSAALPGVSTLPPSPVGEDTDDVMTRFREASENISAAIGQDASTREDPSGYAPMTSEARVDCTNTASTIVAQVQDLMKNLSACQAGLNQRTDGLNEANAMNAQLRTKLQEQTKLNNDLQVRLQQCEEKYDEQVKAMQASIPELEGTAVTITALQNAVNDWKGSYTQLEEEHKIVCEALQKLKDELTSVSAAQQQEGGDEYPDGGRGEGVGGGGGGNSADDGLALPPSAKRVLRRQPTDPLP